jgi:hypothetical protein
MLREFIGRALSAVADDKVVVAATSSVLLLVGGILTVLLLAAAVLRIALAATLWLSRAGRRNSRIDSALTW